MKGLAKMITMLIMLTLLIEKEKKRKERKEKEANGQTYTTHIYTHTIYECPHKHNQVLQINHNY